MTAKYLQNSPFPAKQQICVDVTGFCALYVRCARPWRHRASRSRVGVESSPESFAFISCTSPSRAVSFSSLRTKTNVARRASVGYFPASLRDYSVFSVKRRSIEPEKRWVWRRTGRARRRSPSWTRRKRSCSGPTRRAPSSSSPTLRCPARPKRRARPRVSSTTRYKPIKHTNEPSVRRPRTRLSPNMAS